MVLEPIPVVTGRAAEICAESGEYVKRKGKKIGVMVLPARVLIVAEVSRRSKICSSLRVSAVTKARRCL